jgi:hypothetical protein
MKPSANGRNRKPNSIADGSGADGTAGTVVSGQIEQEEHVGGAAVVTLRGALGGTGSVAALPAGSIDVTR